MNSLVLAIILLAPSFSRAAPFDPNKLSVECLSYEDKLDYPTDIVLTHNNIEIARYDNVYTGKETLGERIKKCKSRVRAIRANIESAREQQKLLDIDIGIGAYFYNDIKIVEPTKDLKAKEMEIEGRLKNREPVNCDFVKEGYARRKGNFPGCGANSALAIRDVVCKDEMGGSITTRALCSINAEKEGATACYAQSISYDVVQMPTSDQKTPENRNSNSRSVE